jgi:hypothetical protein
MTKPCVFVMVTDSWDSFDGVVIDKLQFTAMPHWPSVNG